MQKILGDYEAPAVETDISERFLVATTGRLP